MVICLFWALSHGLTAAGGKEKSPLQCRALAVAHLTKYQDSYARHWDGCFPCPGNKEIPDRDFSVYLQELAQQGAWGSALEVTAFSMTVDRPIFLYAVDNESTRTYVFNKQSQRKPLYLKYDKNQEHFTCLVPEQHFEPDLANVIEGPHTGLRGAAKSVSSTGTRLTIRQKLKCQVSASTHRSETQVGARSTGTRSSVKQKLQAGDQLDDATTETCAKTRTSVRKRLQNQGVDRASCSSTFSSVPRPAALNRPVDLGKDDFSWNCTVCNRVLRAKTQFLLSKKRNGHIRNVHSDKPKSAFHQLRVHYAAVPTRPVNTLPAQGRWICEYCGEGLPWLVESQKRISIVEHFKTCCRAPAKASRKSNAVKRRKSKGGWMGNDFAAQCAKQRQNYGDQTGHTLHVLIGDKAKHTMVTCSVCTRFWNSVADVKRYVAKSGKNKCPGVGGRRTQLKRKSTLQLWENFPTWRQKLAKTWGLRHDERKILQSTPKDFHTVAADNGHKVVVLPGFRQVQGYDVTAYACSKCAQMWCSPSAFFARIRQGCTVKCPGTAGRASLLASKKRFHTWKHWSKSRGPFCQKRGNFNKLKKTNSTGLACRPLNGSMTLWKMVMSKATLVRHHRQAVPFGASTLVVVKGPIEPWICWRLQNHILWLCKRQTWTRRKLNNFLALLLPVGIVLGMLQDRPELILGIEFINVVVSLSWLDRIFVLLTNMLPWTIVVSCLQLIFAQFLSFVFINAPMLLHRGWIP